MMAYLGYRIAELGVRALPEEIADRLAIGVARLAFAPRLRSRRTLEANFARLHPGATAATVRRLARAAFENFALGLIDFLRLARLDPGELSRAIELEGAQHFEAARRAGRGVIVLSAHLGSWERGAAYLAASVPRLHLVARPHRDARVEAFFARLRRARGVDVLGGRPLWLSAARALRRGDWVALMGDRSGPRTGGSVCAWAAALARRTGAVVLPAVIVRLGRGRYRASFEPPLTAEVCAGGGYRAALGGHLRRHAGQWSAFEPVPEGVA